ncbi:hypothetical protein DC3_30980 [Deinococcus cellulosilyticus NBRC 106333 = KACC 11606]|uniref:Aminoglycoside phosphotransferase domain-containing protein n=1 Tax=Deinococcus cellulosilyticus (strain DSM 18568 / NBRC 106333 / KACC 11606 / 5516J-15) TaxID=1223518 RepID=A0A511N3L4_DEIC1|nr:hypothetical protein DC3_30980 [Deinococcus cellulosilyticus NBRC 106333 = KACC 11606]
MAHALPGEQHTFRHEDMQGTKVMVHKGGSFAGRIDWGACGWEDPSHDLEGIPLQASTPMLEACREIQSPPADEPATPFLSDPQTCPLLIFTK